MNEQKFSREDLEQLLTAGLLHADDHARSAWELMAVNPTRWECSPWGDSDGGFWVVGKKDGYVVWYNHIEDGFNVSAYSDEGVIDEYLCNQGDFHDFLMTLTKAGEAEVDGKVPGELNGGGEILGRQTTYWDIAASNGECWRSHFKGKKETFYDSALFQEAKIHNTHPLLVQYHEPWAQLFFSSAPNDITTTVAAVDRAIAQETSGWHRATDFRNADADLASGRGQFMHAPQSIIVVARDALEKRGVRCSVIKSHTSKISVRILLLGSNYVVAEDFWFQKLNERKDG